MSLPRLFLNESFPKIFPTFIINIGCCVDKFEKRCLKYGLQADNINLWAWNILQSFSQKKKKLSTWKLFSSVAIVTSVKLSSFHISTNFKIHSTVSRWKCYYNRSYWLTWLKSCGLCCRHFNKYSSGHWNSPIFLSSLPKEIGGTGITLANKNKTILFFFVYHRINCINEYVICTKV